MKISSVKTHSTGSSGRITGRITRRQRESLPLLAIHDLSGNGYRTYPYRGTPGFYAVRSKKEIKLHEYLLIGGETFKVAAVELIEVGCYEVKALKWNR